MTSDALPPEPMSTVESAVKDAQEALHPQEARVVRDNHGNPLPGTDDPGEDRVDRADGRRGKGSG